MMRDGRWWWGGTGTTVVRAREGRLAVEAPSKYDPAAPLLGALAGPRPDTPDDPLRSFIRSVARVRAAAFRLAVMP